jgi:hypothetical protein
MIMRTIRRLCLILGLIGSLFFVCSGVVFADELDDESTCQCPKGIVSIGDPRFNVMEKCGKPTSTEDSGNIWIYDYGPSEFVRYITFVDDQVQRIQLGGYGKTP